AFATEKVAMIFAPSWRIHEILQINPDLQFKTAPVPQISEKQIAWSSFWVEGVSNKSQNIKAAWEFLDYFSSKDTLVKFYNQATQLRKFGEPYPRLDMASQLEDDPYVGAFVKQGQWAKNWYLCSYTHDNGINDKIIKYFEDAVNKVLKGEGVASALEPAAQGVAQVLNQYGVK
ncbi:MAG TPA: extracellular solute-binding protein, partial [Candidatus Bathyarchaeia archaeon]|nr:extracellular solute-binding protein [Candidatus Bathyarchaeia archaeon]